MAQKLDTGMDVPGTNPCSAIKHPGWPGSIHSQHLPPYNRVVMRTTRGDELCILSLSYLEEYIFWGLFFIRVKKPNYFSLQKSTLWGETTSCYKLITAIFQNMFKWIKLHSICIQGFKILCVCVYIHLALRLPNILTLTLTVGNNSTLCVKSMPWRLEELNILKY